MFTKMKYEDRMALLIDKNEIQLHELERIHYLFPHSTTDSLIITYKQQGFTRKSPIVNPYYNQRNFIFDGGATNQITPFKDILRKAIEKKLNKNYLGKDKLTLIIDNRTILYNADEIISSLHSIQDYLDNLPFKEVWIYTGYYTDTDSSNAEFALIATKISDEKLKILDQQNS